MNTEIFNQAANSEEPQVKLPSMDTLRSNTNERNNGPVQSAKSPLLPDPITQTTQTMTKPLAPSGSASTSKNRLITEFLPPINTVAALRDNCGNQVQQKQTFDKEISKSSTTQIDKVCTISVSNLI